MYIRMGRKLQLHGGGTSERSFIHIDDVSDAIECISRDGKLGETYHISTDRVITIRALVEMICKRMNVAFEDHVEIVGERLGKDAAYRLDSSKLRSELGWQDRISLEDGIDQTTRLDRPVFRRVEESAAGLYSQALILQHRIRPMGQEIDLLANYPRTKRNLEERAQQKSEQDRAIARQFGKEFFDGDRRHGYGGFNYLPRFWQPVIPTLQSHFGLDKGSSVLDVGCAKGFMMHDMAALIPDIMVKGVDVSAYAIEHAIEDMKPHVQVADAVKLPFPNKSFDVAISINTIHNLERGRMRHRPA